MSRPSFSISKLLTNSDITLYPSLPTDILQHIQIPQGTNFIDLQVTDSMEKKWTFRYYTRPGGNRTNPVFTVGWLQFVQAKRLETGDKLTISGRQDGSLYIEVTRQSNVTFQGEPVYLDIENCAQYSTIITMSKPPFTVYKLLTNSDITFYPALPTEILQHIPIPKGTNFVDLQVTDSMEKNWTLRYYTRPSGNRKNPVFTVGWLQFVRAKRLEVGDKLTICGRQDGALQIQVTRASNVTCQGEPVYLDVKNYL
ncbi:hypothetical protein EZV62_006414 [Acer yangbiense]|uniref:TF-B3 domain-containing protein n=1 Tax=Acer yangbiense TaxID=1000413 RepID=A0A5C7I8T4_9ROSI|nr:hypothetical protein EZV62_006414 [Acer yangbiense]